MNDSENSPGKSIKMFLGTLGIFAIFGFLALILSGFAGHETPEERLFEGEFSKATTEARWANLKEVRATQSKAFDQAKVDASLKEVGATVAKPAKTSIVVPGSPTFLKQAEQQPAPAAEAAPAADAQPADKKAEPGSAAPATKPAEPGSVAPEKEAPKPGPVNAPETKAETKEQPSEGVKEKAPAQPAPAPAPANQ